MKKINFKLVGSAASFVISLIFLLFTRSSKVCVLFTCIFLALCLVLFALFRQEKTNQSITATEQDLEENPPDEEEFEEIQKLKKKIIKKAKRLDFAFYTCAFLLVVVGIFAVV